jgi:hypothetical protein
MPRGRLRGVWKLAPCRPLGAPCRDYGTAGCAGLDRTLSRAGTNIQDSIFMAKQAITPNNCKQTLAGASTELGSKVEKMRAHRCGARAMTRAFATSHF